MEEQEETYGKEERWKVKVSDYGNCHRPTYPYLRLLIQRKQKLLVRSRQSTHQHCDPAPGI